MIQTGLASVLAFGDRPADDDWTLLRRGDDDALATLFARHKDFVHRLAWSLTADPSLAEDVTQEVFLRVVQAKRRWRPRARFRTLLYRVTANTASELRRHRFRETHDDVEPPPVPARPIGELTDLAQALAALPERQREVVVLRYLEGWSTRETARALGCRSGTVKVHLHRALGRLRTLMTPPSIQTSNPLLGPTSRGARLEETP